jgi:hypothetical protein
MPVRSTTTPKMEEKLKQTALKRDKTPNKQGNRTGAHKELEDPSRQLRDSKLRSSTSNGGLQQ